MKEHRNTAQIQIRALDSPALDNIPNDKTLRIMVFCAGDGQSNPRDIAFPYQSELKVNGGEFKANLRGLKNKPGSTRPVDITDALRLKPLHYQNNVDLTYALSAKESDHVHQVSSENSCLFHLFPSKSPLGAVISSPFLTVTTEVLPYGQHCEDSFGHGACKEACCRKENNQSFSIG
jgi:hypothetical protein